MNRIWEFVQHSQTFLFRKGWPSLYHSLYETLKIWIQNYKILLLTKYTTKQYACVYPLHCWTWIFRYIYYWNWSQRTFFSSTAPVIYSLSPVLLESLEAVVPVLSSVMMPTWSWGCVPLLWSIALCSLSGVIPVDLPLICWSLFCLFKPTTEVL